MLGLRRGIPPGVGEKRIDGHLAQREGRRDVAVEEDPILPDPDEEEAETPAVHANTGERPLQLRIAVDADGGIFFDWEIRPFKFAGTTDEFDIGITGKDRVLDRLGVERLEGGGHEGPPRRRR